MVDIIHKRNQKEWLDKAEDIADLVVRRSRKYLPHAARFCLVSTFIEDGFRLCTQWSDQVEFIGSIWNAPTFLSALFILINILSQFIGSGMVLLRKEVKIGCGILIGTVVMQTIGYSIWSQTFLIRNFSLIGSMILLMAESNEETRSLMAGLPSTGEASKPMQYLLLGGRILVVLMFVTIIRFSLGFVYLVTAAVSLALIILVAVGYKTKLCALILVVMLSLMNVMYNNFWSAPSDGVLWDYLKYDFFQTLSVIGGLMLVVAYGPGGVSVDDYKKKW